MSISLSLFTYPTPREYLPELARVRAQREATLEKQREDSTARMLSDLAVDRASNPNFVAQDRWNPDEEGQEEEDDGGELNIIDRSASMLGIVPFRLHSVYHAMPCQDKHRWHVVRHDLFGISPFGFLG